MEKIYLGDWLYNAGIVGFLRINNHLWEVKDQKLISKDENLLKIRDNYIEIDREIFDGFTDRFFDYAFNLYSRHDRKLKRFKDKQDKEELIENNVREFLKNFYGQKSFLNKSVKKDRKQKFYEDFEKPLKKDNNQKDKKLTCVICGERPAKKDTSFDTGFSTIFGLNKDAVNFAWNFNTKLPSCDICEIIYFCHFAGLTELNGKYYFVNLDDSVELLLIKNDKFEMVIKEGKEKSSENPIIDFFTKYFKFKRGQDNYTLNNTNFLEIEIKEMSKKSKKNIAKVFSFNIDYKTAKFIEKNKENLQSLSKSYFILPDDETRVYILTEFLNLILKKDLNYGLLYKIFKRTTQDKAYVSNYNLQRLIFMYLLYKQKVGGKKMGLEENDLWVMYYRGEDLLKRLKERDAENKIQSTAYKLLNALKIGDTNQFMDVMIRVHMAYDLEVPSLLIKVLQDKDNFYLLGYSFLNGLLGKENKLQEDNQ